LSQKEGNKSSINVAQKKLELLTKVLQKTKISHSHMIDPSVMVATD
jgi:hypothetical protein